MSRDAVPRMRRSAAAAATTIRSGTRTRSSTRCTSAPSSTATTTASATFPGLTQKLDYLQGLGVTCLWLLPFYPVAAADDGYDIADYESVHPSYGTLDDFKTFVARGARAAASGSSPSSSSTTPPISIRGSRRRGRRRPDRPSATSTSGATPTRSIQGRPDHLHGHREVELDVGRSGRRAYYWHRFFSHQPDLNFDNPAVRRRGHRRDAVLARSRRRRRCGSTRCRTCRARRHELREPAGDARRPEADPRASWTRATRIACCSPKRTSGRPTCAPTSATATNATWRSTSR